MSEACIYLDGRHYDRMFAMPDAVREFFLKYARAAGGPVLELACGTGPVCIPLAFEGFEVTDLDAAPAMLETARAKARQVSAGVDWVEGSRSSTGCASGASCSATTASTPTTG